MKSVGWVRKLMTFVMMAVALAALVVWFATAKQREEGARSFCLLNIKGSASALLMYAQENGNRFPPIKKGEEDAWTIAAGPYAHSAIEQWCVRDPLLQRAMEIAGKNNNLSLADQFKLIHEQLGVAGSFRVNAKLSDVRLSDIKEPSKTWLLEERKPFHSGYRLIAYADGNSVALKTDRYTK